MILLTRWWRMLTNPMPQPGQHWRIDGVGKVRITALEASMHAFINFNVSWELVANPANSGTWHCAQVRAQGVLVRIEISDLQARAGSLGSTQRPTTRPPTTPPAPRPGWSS